jgi:photosystem II stability/assembly factor-like uncharacterized protein
MRLLLGTDEGLLALNLGGSRAWTSAEVLWRGGPVAAVATDPANSQRVHLASKADGIYRSEDGGRTWERYLGADLCALAVPRGDPKVLIACGAPCGVYRSADGGGYWTAARMACTHDPHSALPGPVVCVGVNPRDPSRMFAGTSRGVILGSYDGGLEWLQMPSKGVRGRVRAILVREATSDVVLVATDAGVYRSSDRGHSWRSAAHGLDGAAVTALGEAGDTLLAATDAGRVYRQPAGAVRWWPATDPLGGEVSGFLIAPGAPFCFTTGGGLFAGAADGSHWLTMAAGLPAIRAAALAR